MGKYTNRSIIIKRLTKDRSVLDLGCVDHSIKKERETTWLHKLLEKNSKYCLGVDIDKESIELLKKKGYNVICQDAERLKLNKKFDVVVAGELIEHLRNPGLFLESYRNHLKDKGILIISTPNCFAFRYMIRILILGYAKAQETHNHWYELQTLSKMIEPYFKIRNTYYTFDSKGLRYVTERTASFFHRIFAPTILVVCEKR